MSDLDLYEKRVLMRVDFNVPIQGEKVADDTRIRASLPGIKDALSRRARLLLVSHLGRPTEGQFDEKESLAPVAKHLSGLLGVEVPLKRDWLGGVSAEPGKAVLLENCRFNTGEKKDDVALAKKVAALCDIYVNDAFGAAHRAEATTHGVAKYAPIACAGPLMAAEIEALSKALQRPARPLVAIVGGSKVSTKLTVLAALSEKVDRLIPGGGIANTFMLAAGMKVGKSLAEPELVGEASASPPSFGPRGAMFPFRPTWSAPRSCPQRESRNQAGGRGWRGRSDSRHRAEDRGRLRPVALRGRDHRVERTGRRVEFDQFAQGTRAIAQAIAGSRAFSLAGGGETLAAIARYGVAERISYVSTGGGAFLEFLEGKKLPAIEILERRSAA